MPIPLIHDGDHGGDDFITTLIMLANPQHFNLLGITSCFGNVGVTLAADNALRAIEMAGADIPVFIGADGPFASAKKEGDDAFSGDGLGGVNLPPPQGRPQETPALEWALSQLEAAETPITFCVTGPATNMAHLIKHIEEHAPALREKVGPVIIMGGGIEIGGNIKPYAEFNFYMDPEAADYVLNSDHDIVLHTLDTTHSLVMNPTRQEQVLALPEPSSVLCKIMRAAEHLDLEHFGSDGAFMHDEQTALFLMAPELYETELTALGVNCGDEPGRLYKKGEGHSIRLVSKLKDPDAAFAIVLQALAGITSAN